MKKRRKKLSFRQRIIRVVRVDKGKKTGRHYFLLFGRKAKLLSRLSTYIKLRDFKYKYEIAQKQTKKLIAQQKKLITQQKKLITRQEKQIRELRGRVSRASNKANRNEQLFKLFVVSTYQKERMIAEMGSWHGGMGVTDEQITLGQERQ
jgi:hypothetical protein